MSVALLLTVSACVSVPSTREYSDGATLQLSHYAASSIPSFTASIVINAPISVVLATMTAFDDWPQWAYRCNKAVLLDVIGFNEAFVYQVTGLPIVQDRDMIMHAIVKADGGGEKVLITVEAASHFCDNKDTSACRDINQSRLVRVTELDGSFELARLGPDQTRVTWEQHLDPAGSIPASITRLMLPDVPLRSLRRLKALVESSH